LITANDGDPINMLVTKKVPSLIAIFGLSLTSPRTAARLAQPMGQKGARVSVGRVKVDLFFSAYFGISAGALVCRLGWPLGIRFSEVPSPAQSALENPAPAVIARKRRMEEFIA
jgi:hypothetical protein